VLEPDVVFFVFRPFLLFGAHEIVANVFFALEHGLVFVFDVLADVDQSVVCGVAELVDHDVQFVALLLEVFLVGGRDREHGGSLLRAFGLLHLHLPERGGCQLLLTEGLAGSHR